MSFPDQVVLKSIANMAIEPTKNTRKKRTKSKGLFSRNSNTTEVDKKTTSEQPIDIVRGYYAKIKKAREELNNA